MKLFINTAILCTIPKVVNAAEKKLQDWLTPNAPTNAQLEETALLEAQNEEAIQQYTAPEFDIIIPQDAPPVRLTEEEVALLENPNFLTGKPLDLPPGTYAPEVNEKGTIIPQANKLGIVQGNGSTAKESTMANAYNQSVKKGKAPVVHHRASFTRRMVPMTKEVHDKINEFWRGMEDINKREGKTNGCFPYRTEDAAVATNEFFNTDWGISTLTCCLRAPGSKTRIERDDCPSQAEVDGKVIRSVSEFSKMNKLNIKTKKEET